MRNALLGVEAVDATYFRLDESGGLDVQERRAHVSGMSIYIPEFHPSTVGGSVPSEMFDVETLRGLADRVLSLRQAVEGCEPEFEGQRGASRSWTVSGEFEGMPLQGVFVSSYGNRTGWNSPMLAELRVGNVPAPEYFGVEEMDLGLRLSSDV